MEFLIAVHMLLLAFQKKRAWCFNSLLITIVIIMFHKLKPRFKYTDLSAEELCKGNPDSGLTETIAALIGQEGSDKVALMLRDMRQE